jgi:hypothetical protein
MNEQNQLTELYNKCYTYDILKNLEKIHELSSPFVLDVSKNYLKSPIKIMFVGKEVNDWGKRLNESLTNDSLIEHMRQKYKKEFSDKTKWEKSPFFRTYLKIRENLTDNTTGAVIWNNLLKFSRDTGNGFSKNSVNHKGVVELSKEIFQKEFEILKPDFMIFATSTGSGYDQKIIDFFPQISDSEIIEPKNLWKFKIGSTICYRTRHPNATKFKGKKTVNQYYEDIIEDIKLILSKSSPS